jgi:hypothetical protein
MGAINDRLKQINGDQLWHSPAKLPWWFYVLLSLLIRWPGFLVPVIDHDESTYLIIARELLNGQWLFDYHLDVKPPGIFVLFALFLSVFDHYSVVRWGAALAIGLTGYLLVNSRKRIYGERDGNAAWTGLLFVIAASIHRWQWSANTEIFFMLCTAAGLRVLVSGNTMRNHFYYGLVMGIGLLFKYHVLFDFTAIWFLFSLDETFFKRIGFFVRRGLVALTGMLLPLAMFSVIYHISGRWSQWTYVMLEVPSRYQVERSLADSINFFAEFWLSFLPIGLLFIHAIYRAIHSKNLRFLYQSIGWLLMSWTAVLLTGKSFYHYWFQALLPLCFFAVYPVLRNGRPTVQNRWFAILSLAAIVIVPIHITLDLKRKPTHAKLIANQIMEDLSEEDEIFVDYKNIIYVLCDKSPVNHYPHTTLMHDSSHIKAFDIDVHAEYDLIKKAEPKWMVLYGEGHPLISTYTDSFYLVKDSFENNLKLWRRN